MTGTSNLINHDFFIVQDRMSYQSYQYHEVFILKIEILPFHFIKKSKIMYLPSDLLLGNYMNKTLFHNPVIIKNYITDGQLN